MVSYLLRVFYNVTNSLWPSSICCYLLLPAVTGEYEVVLYIDNVEAKYVCDNTVWCVWRISPVEGNCLQYMLAFRTFIPL